MDTPPRISPEASPFASQPLPLPFFLRVLICFLAFDAGQRLFVLIRWVIERTNPEELTASEFDPQNAIGVTSLVLWILVDLLLVLLLGLRTWWGRLWTQTIFTVHFLHVGYTLVVAKPELWLYLDRPGRARLVLTLMVDLAFVGYLLSDRARRILRR
ncbi:MAG: hypothetical protein AB7N76_24070 [Planctomycetota bacterium]